MGFQAQPLFLHIKVEVEEGSWEAIPPSLWVEDKTGRGAGARSRKQETAKPTEACSHLPHLPSLPLTSEIRTEGVGGPCSRPYLISFLAGTKLIICKENNEQGHLRMGQIA